MPGHAQLVHAKTMIRRVQRVAGSSVPAIRKVSASALARFGLADEIVRLANAPTRGSRVEGRPLVALPDWTPLAMGRVRFSVNPGAADALPTTVDITIADPQVPSVSTPGSTVVSEVSLVGIVLDNDVAHQYIDGVLTIAPKGSTLAGEWRHFVLTFRETSPDAPSANTALSESRVRVASTTDEGQPAHRVGTDQAAFVIQEHGASLSSLLDVDGHDWIAYHAEPDDQPTGAKSIFRGVPNFPFPEGHFHPGFESSDAVVVSAGPLRAVIRCSSKDGKWAYELTIYPTHIRHVVTKADRAFWWLYEGTPGGEDHDGRCQNFRVHRNGHPESAGDVSWEMVSADTAWAAFRVPGMGTAFGRTLFVGRAGAGHPSSYYLSADNGAPIAPGGRGAMTVFGFGRSGMEATIMPADLPATFVMGLAEPTNATDLERQVLTALASWTTAVEPYEPHTTVTCDAT
jgi:hypothetical protein